MPFACRSRRESAFGLSSPLPGRPGRRFGTSTFGFATAASRPPMAVESRDTWPMSASPSTSTTRASCILSAGSEAENSATVRENFASLGISPRRDQPHNRRNAGSAPNLSIKCRVVGRSHTALAGNARARARRSSGGRSGPLPGVPRKPSTPTRSSAATKRRCVPSRGPTSSVNAGNSSPRNRRQKSDSFVPRFIGVAFPVACGCCKPKILQGDPGTGTSSLKIKSYQRKSRPFDGSARGSILLKVLVSLKIHRAYARFTDSALSRFEEFLR